jgi:hypothetical protein
MNSFDIGPLFLDRLLHSVRWCIVVNTRETLLRSLHVVLIITFSFVKPISDGCFSSPMCSIRGRFSLRRGGCIVFVCVNFEFSHCIV